MHTWAMVTAVSVALAAPASRDTTDAALLRGAPTPEAYVVAQFRTHDVVLLGEHHKLRKDPQLVQRLVPMVHRNGVRLLAFEFARRRDQPLLDSLVFRREWSEPLANEILFRSHAFWGFAEYRDILRAAWALNRSLSPGVRRFRVLALGNAPDPAMLDDHGAGIPEDVRRGLVWNGETEANWARVILDAVANGEKVLGYMGMHHAFTRYRQPIVVDGRFIGWSEMRCGNHVYAALGARAITVGLHAFWRGRGGYDAPEVLAVHGRLDAAVAALPMHQRRVGIDLARSPVGEWTDSASVYSHGRETFRLRDLADGWILEGPIGDVEPVTPIPDFVSARNVSGARMASWDRRYVDSSAAAFMRDIVADAATEAATARALWQGRRSSPFRVHVGAAANLGYQLDCLADVTGQCAREDFQALWKTPAMRSSDDAAFLARWAALRRASPTPATRTAFASALQYDEVAERAAAAAPASVQQEAARVVAHFTRRFDAWWHRAAPPVERGVAATLRAMLASDTMHAALADARRVLDVADPGRPVTVALVVLPGLAHGGTSGGQAGEIMVMEVTPQPDAGAAAEVVLHEYVHLLFAERAAERNAALRAALTNAGGANGIAMANLLNEGLATALGNIRWAREVLPAAAFAARRADSVGFYARASIHRAGVVYAEVLDSLRAHGASIDAAAPIIAAVASARWPDAASRPDVALHEFVLIMEEGTLDGAVRLMARALRPVGIREVTVPAGTLTCRTLPQQLQRFPDVAVVVVFPLARAMIEPGDCAPTRPGWTATRTAAGALRLTFVAATEDALRKQMDAALGDASVWLLGRSR
jgi:hypothetical protein